MHEQGGVSLVEPEALVSQPVKAQDRCQDDQSAQGLEAPV
jgi:hypothetical protein